MTSSIIGLSFTDIERLDNAYTRANAVDCSVTTDYDPLFPPDESDGMDQVQFATSVEDVVAEVDKNEENAQQANAVKEKKMMQAEQNIQNEIVRARAQAAATAEMEYDSTSELTLEEAQEAAADAAEETVIYNIGIFGTNTFAA